MLLNSVFAIFSHLSQASFSYTKKIAALLSSSLRLALRASLPLSNSVPYRIVDHSALVHGCIDVAERMDLGTPLRGVRESDHLSNNR